MKLFKLPLRSKGVFFILLILAILFFGTKKYFEIDKKTSAKIYAAIVMHNERSPHYLCDDILFNRDLYLKNRQKIIDFADMIVENEAALSFQTDWQHIAVSKKWDDFEIRQNSNGKTLFEYLDSLDKKRISIEAHAHEDLGVPKYNYADVAKTILDLGVEDKKVVGGAIFYPPGQESWTKFRRPLRGNIFTDFWWQPEILWGLGVQGHPDGSEFVDSGIWRPKSADDFFEHDSNGNLIYVGGHKSDIDAMLGKLYSGELEDGKIYTAFLFENSCNRDDNLVEKWEDLIEKYESEVASGTLVWATIPEMVNIWKTDYSGIPNIFFGDLSSQQRR